MSEVDLATRHGIVSMAARGRRSLDIADRTGLPVAVIRQIIDDNGGPDMGQLATQADTLRKQLDKSSGHPSAGASAHDGLDLLKAEAEKVGATKLVKRAEHIGTLLDQLRVDLKAAVKVWDADAKERDERAARMARLAELKAEAEKIAAELKAGRANAPRTDLSKVVREWAKSSGVECPAYGRVPQKVLDAYAKAVA